MLLFVVVLIVILSFEQFYDALHNRKLYTIQTGNKKENHIFMSLNVSIYANTQERPKNFYERNS